MDNDLERSVRLLEDAVSTPGRGLFKNIPEKRQRLNLSITMHDFEAQQMLEDTNISSRYEDTMNLFVQANQTLSGSVIHNRNPWKNTLENMYSEFFEILQSYSGGHDVLEIVADFARCCSDAVNVIQGLKSKVAVFHIEEESVLIQERDIWRLLFVLYQDRLTTKLIGDDTMLEPYTGLSEKTCMQNLFKRDNLLREVQLVIDWLERCKAETDDTIVDLSDCPDGWENTAHQIKSAETIAFGSTRKVVDKLDPDVMNYQKLPLHDMDLEDEKRLCRVIFNKVRCGKLEQAQEICIATKHYWRASLLEGWKLYHNSNIKEEDVLEMDQDMNDSLKDGEYYETEGNPSRDIWKVKAIKYCDYPNLRIEEKAAVAVYSGILKHILPMCKTWDDNLWAYLRTMVDIRVESEIRDSINREYSPLPDAYWNQKMSLNEIFKELDSHPESKSRQNIIKKFIILDNVNHLMILLKDWVEDPNTSTTFLRFATHFVLFLDQIGQLNNREIIEITIEEYVKRLFELQETRISAFYLSKVSETRQLYLYASHLETILDNEERKAALSYAENFGLNVLEITKRVVEVIRNKPCEINQTNLMTKLTDLDLLKIGALDWVTFYNEQRAEALIQSNALIFTFLTLSKLDAAQLAFNKIPQDCASVLAAENTNENLENIIKEHMSYKAYLEAHEGFNEWYEKHKSKPHQPRNIPESADLTERVAYQHKMSQYETDMERWKITMNQLTKAVKNVLYNVLLFPESWLSTAKDGDYLRSICIPEIVLLLYTVLSESGLNEECVQLADVIASEKYKLYAVYSKEKLSELLLKLAESALGMLDTRQKTWELGLQ